LVGAAAALVGPKAWDRFSSSDIQFPTTASQHFTDLAGAGRYDFWRVAIDGFSDKPLTGHGAGTYEFQWDRGRTVDIPVKDAHSLYLESLDELGIVGGALTIGLMIAILAVGAGAWRRARGEERQAASALLAVAVAFAVAAGIDWMWELADIAFVFFAVAGALVALACSQRDPRQGRGGTGQARYAVAVVTVLVGWLSIVGLVGPLVVDYEISASQAAVRRGNLSDALGHAQTARDIEPFAASPYLQLALIYERGGDYATAQARVNDAINREPDNWQLWLLRARIERESGDPAASSRDARKAEALNPLSTDVVQQTLTQAATPSSSGGSGK
jgi:tetratricopeptide (TPR) repeat protein